LWEPFREIPDIWKSSAESWAEAALTEIFSFSAEIERHF
jgi:hypothetical protein